MDMVRFVSSGSEATMAAIRLARGFTGKKDIVKIEGGFHGAHDAVLVKAGSGCDDDGRPGLGRRPCRPRRPYPAGALQRSDALETLLATHHDVAALIIEPVLGNIGPVLPKDNYLEDIREITKTHDVLLIFDEVITGYRLGIGGAQVKYGVKPDLTTLGKIIGGGLPDRCIRRAPGDHGAWWHRRARSTRLERSRETPSRCTAGIATLRWLHDHPVALPELARENPGN